MSIDPGGTMQKMEAPQQAANWKDGFNILVSLGLVAATMVAPIIHKNFGRRALSGSNVLGAVVGIFLVGAFGNNPTVGFNYFWVWLLFICGRRIETRRLLDKGAMIHSNFMGEPAMIPWIKRPQTARAVELVALLAIGALLLDMIPGLGAILIVGGIGLVAVDATARAILQRRNEMMQDVLIEQTLQRSKW
jgi:hypothetical protein